ncbi:hypothetical protein JQX13_46435 [Archangium violaceum]|uniref:hypothetical protein n=1 Tax=Archangium violaceum TaxID=83451 RepID=UPI00193C820E|nr:hypothetical protein [Archangium violaceum]QRK07386.1 hypothetical protein JQX13_46435 [Archangium violaceum]
MPASQFPFVTLTVNVRDRVTGKRVGGLTRDAFSLREDMVPGEIVSFEEQRLDGPSSTAPVDVVFVFDQTGSMSEEIAGLVERSRQFADILGNSGFDFRLALVSYTGCRAGWGAPSSTRTREISRRSSARSRAASR